MEMDDKAPRAVPANSGHVPTVTRTETRVLPWVCLTPGWLRVSLCAALGYANRQVKQCTAIEGALD